jgi:SAM-dependent methyltransferase
MEELAQRQFVDLEEDHFWFVGRRRIFMHLLERELGGRADVQILDVGCGAGGMLGPLARFGDAAGIDVSPELVSVARRRGFRVAVAGVHQMPAAPASLDLITLFDTLEHIRDDVGALRACREALAPGGLLFASVPAYQLLYANNDRVAHHERRYTASELRRKLRTAGLAPVKVSYFNTLLFPAILPVVLAKKALERVRDPGDATNLSTPIPPPLNRALAAIMGFERHLLARASLPVGHSLVAMARRPR